MNTSKAPEVNCDPFCASGSLYVSPRSTLPDSHHMLGVTGKDDFWCLMGSSAPMGGALAPSRLWSPGDFVTERH